MHGSHGMKTVLLICFESLRLDGGSGLYLFVLGKLGKTQKDGTSVYAPSVSVEATT